MFVRRWDSLSVLSVSVFERFSTVFWVLVPFLNVREKVREAHCAGFLSMPVGIRFTGKLESLMCINNYLSTVRYS